MLSPVERPPIKSIICALRGIFNRRTADGAAEPMKSCVDVHRLRRSFRHPSNHRCTDAHRRALSFFSADRQHTYQPVFSKHLEIGVNCSTDTKSTKTIAIKFYYAPYIMGNLNFPHFAHFAATKCGKCAKFTLRELQKSVFWAFCTFCLTKSPKGAKSIFRKSELSAFSAQ